MTEVSTHLPFHEYSPDETELMIRLKESMKRAMPRHEGEFLVSEIELPDLSAEEN